MLSFALNPQMQELIAKAKLQGGEATCDPRAMYPVGHKCSASTQPVTIKISRPVQTSPLRRRQVIETPTETVVATTDNNGNVKAVKVTEKNKFLIPAALAAAFFLFGG